MLANNQSGIVRTLFSSKTLQTMHNKLQLLLAPPGGKIALVKTGKGLCSLNKISQDNFTVYAQVPVYNDLADFTKQLLTTH